MLLGKNGTVGTHYEVLSVKEDASHDEIRASYRSAILNFHPDKLQQIGHQTSHPDHEADRFLKVQKAWEVLSNSKLRVAYDIELQASKGDAIVGEEVSLDDMTVEDGGEEVVELFYQCRCGDYFSIDSDELGKLGYRLLREGNDIYFKTEDALPSSVVLPCGSCSLKLLLSINPYASVSVDDRI